MSNNTIYLKLLNIQNNLSAPKNEYNSFGKYNCRSLDGILKSLKPLLDAEGCLLVFDSMLQEAGGRVYVTSTAKLIDVDNGNMIEASASAREDEVLKGMTGAQITTAATTYSKKTAVCSLFAIDNETRDVKVMDDPWIRSIREMLFKHNVNEESVCRYYHVSSLHDLADFQREDCVSILENQFENGVC